jgi:hypothetical protein
MPIVGHKCNGEVKIPVFGGQFVLIDALLTCFAEKLGNEKPMHWVPSMPRGSRLGTEPLTPPDLSGRPLPPWWTSVPQRGKSSFQLSAHGCRSARVEEGGLGWFVVAAVSGRRGRSVIDCTVGSARRAPPQRRIENRWPDGMLCAAIQLTALRSKGE